MSRGREKKSRLRERIGATLGLWLPPLRWRLAATKDVWRPEIGRRLEFRAAPDPFPGGFLDFPRPGLQLPDRIATISGWAVFPDEPVASIEVWIDDVSLGKARLGIPRPDIAAIRGNPQAATCGFELTTDIEKLGSAGRMATVRVRATSVGGATHDLEPVTVEIETDDRSSLDDDRLPPPPAQTPRTADDRRPHLLVSTHQLNLGGAQLYLMDLLGELVRRETLRMTVVSALDGRLRPDLEDLGVPVHITGFIPMDDLSAHIGRIEELTGWAAGRDFDAVFVNTATAHSAPGAEVASELGIPAVWAIHESFPPAVLWAGATPEICGRLESALAEAAKVIFEAEATRRLFEPPLAPSQTVTLPYGLDLAPIEKERGEFDMASARRAAGIPQSADVLLCVGTVEARKAQIPLAQAFELIADRHPRAHLVIVGAGSNLDSLTLGKWIDGTEHAGRVRMLPVTANVHAWYALADLLVCASDIESLPRTVLEAMALETPVLATDVFGIPELIDDGKTGWLCEPRDVRALAEALDRFLITPEAVRREVAESARLLVERRHDLPEYANQMMEILDEVIQRDTSDPNKRIVAGPASLHD